MISGVTLTIIMVVILFVLLIPGQWIFVALGVSGIAGIILGSGADYLTTVGTITWNTTNNFVLSAVPMFMFMGELIVQSGLSSNFYKGLMKWCRRIPGGLLHANVVACAFYSAISGSSVATAAGIGSIAIPETKKRGYPVRTIYGSIAASGTLGILIPPSTVLILYGSLTDQSVVKLFAASAIPGIVLTLMFMVYIFFNGVYLKKKGQYNIVDTEAESLSTWQAIKGIAPIVITIVVLLGSLYTGKATPVESAAMGTFIVLVFGFASKGLSWKKIVESAKSTSKSIAMILTLMISASYLTFALSQSSVNRHLTTWVIDQGFTPLAILTIIGLIYLVLGCFMDGSSMIMLTIPLLAPICKELGVDLIWFGVYITLLVQIGQVTPPMGLNLFMVQGIDKEAKLNDIIRGVIPFLIGMLIFAVLMIMFPQMTAWLPEVMGF